MTSVLFADDIPAKECRSTKDDCLICFNLSVIYFYGLFLMFLYWITSCDIYCRVIKLMQPFNVV